MVVWCNPPGFPTASAGLGLPNPDAGGQRIPLKPDALLALVSAGMLVAYVMDCCGAGLWGLLVELVGLVALVNWLPPWRLSGANPFGFGQLIAVSQILATQSTESGSTDTVTLATHPPLICTSRPILSNSSEYPKRSSDSLHVASANALRSSGSVSPIRLLPR